MKANNRAFLATYISQCLDKGEREWYLSPEDVMDVLRDAAVPAGTPSAKPMNATEINTRQEGRTEPMAEQKSDSTSTINNEHIQAQGSLDDLYAAVSDCKRCGLGQTRNKLVFGAGNPDAGIMFIGEAPGADEDAQGIPFVGRAGKLLTKMIEAMHLSRDDIYIGNILKCRPPGNRDPKPDEIEVCEPILLRQIEIIKPKVICALGRISGQTLLRTKSTLGSLRGTVHDYHGVKFIVTYHPAALLRNPNWKRGAWDDLKLVRREFDGLEL